VVRWPLRRLLHLHHPQRRLHPPPHLLRRDALVPGAVGHVVVDRGHEKLVVRVLEDQADEGADRGQGAVAQDQVADPDGAAAAEQAVDVKEQGGLPGAVRSQQGEGLPFRYVQVDLPQGHLAVRIGEGDPLQGDRRR
jgi:hypothetical protein